MSTMYCALCRRPVEARRQPGAATIVLGVLTIGLSLLALPFYPKRCPICRSSALHPAPPRGVEDGAAALPQVTQLERRLRLAEEELEAAAAELRRVEEERDFYRQLRSPARPDAKGGS